MRHTLFKILVCICLFFLVIIVLIVSLPSVVTNSVFGLDGSMVDMENPTTLLESYNHLAADISAVVEEGYDAALAKVEQIIEDGGYDYDLSMDALSVLAVLFVSIHQVGALCRQHAGAALQSPGQPHLR